MTKVFSFLEFLALTVDKHSFQDQFLHYGTCSHYQKKYINLKFEIHNYSSVLSLQNLCHLHPVRTPYCCFNNGAGIG